MILVIARFGFEGWIWVLIASVPDLCILYFHFCAISLPSYNIFKMLSLPCVLIHSL